MDEIGKVIADTGKRRSSRLRSKLVQMPKQEEPKKASAKASAKTSAKTVKEVKQKKQTSTETASITTNKPASRSSSRLPRSPHSPHSPRSPTSPVYSRARSSNSLTANEFMQTRLDKYEYLQSITDNNYFLNIEKLLASIEEKATGIVCLSKPSPITVNGKANNNFRFAIKIAKPDKNDSDKEIYILKNMIDFIKKGYHNLPIIYKSFKKKRAEIESNSIDSINEFLRKYANYNVYVNELAKGDLKKAFDLYDAVDGANSEINDEILINSIVQILFAIASLHNLGIRHNDTHFGNFLYHKIPAGGYIKYTIDDKTYYLKNLGYLWVIWDFGISSQLYQSALCDYFNDYEMLSLFLRKDEGFYNMRFEGIQGKKTVRRLHGNLTISKDLPESIKILTDTIYNLSTKDTQLHPDIPIDEGNKLLESKDPKIITKVKAMSLPCYKITEKGQNIDEKTFLTKYILPIFSSILKQDEADIKDEDILFHIDLKLEPLIYVRDLNSKILLQETINKYHEQKIVLKIPTK